MAESGSVFKDIRGRKFGRLTPIMPTAERRHRSVIWQCRCDCGNTFYASYQDLIYGRNKSCGCLKKEREDLSGRRFGRLVAIEKIGSRRNVALWRCKCDCGNECEVLSNNLKSLHTVSCGCAREDFCRENKPADLAGRRFGRLVAIEKTDKRFNHYVVWRCRCDCGNEKEVPSSYLVSGKVQSCGCLKQEQAAEAFHRNIHYFDGTCIERITAKTPSGRNKSGVTGVSFSREKNKWVASISFQSKRHYLGAFDTLEDAAAARRKAEETYFDSFTAWYRSVYGEKHNHNVSTISDQILMGWYEV